MVRNATGLGYEIVVVDGGSPDELLKEYEGYGAHVYEQIIKGKDIGPPRRQAIEIANRIGREVDSWIEPEKYTYILEHHKTVEPIILGYADMVVPERKSMKSYPKFQRYSEWLANKYFYTLTGKKLDVMIGPRTWRRELSRYFLEYNGEYGDGSEYIFIPVMNAIINGERVIGVDVDFTYPEEQKVIEEDNEIFEWKRILQLYEISSAHRAQWNKPKKDLK